MRKGASRFAMRPLDDFVLLGILGWIDGGMYCVHGRMNHGAEMLDFGAIVHADHAVPPAELAAVIAGVASFADFPGPGPIAPGYSPCPGLVVNGDALLLHPGIFPYDRDSPTVVRSEHEHNQITTFVLHYQTLLLAIGLSGFLLLKIPTAKD